MWAVINLKASRIWIQDSEILLKMHSGGTRKAQASASISFSTNIS